jgi:Trk K+ transport system NAD-binding subunit
MEPAMPVGDDREELSDHVIVCGLGNVGYRIVRILIRLGERGAIVTKDLRPDWQAAIEPSFSLFVGDARGDELLRRAGVERARAILAVTNDDLANVSIALDAQRLNPRIAVTVRLFDQALAGHLEKSMRIRRALSASALAARAFAAAALGRAVQGAFETEGANWSIEAEVARGGEPLEKAAIDPDRPLCRMPIVLERGEEIHVRPGPDIKVAAGDRLLFLTARPGGQMGGQAGGSRGKTKRPLSAAAFKAGVRLWWREIPKALRISFAAMAVLIVTSVVILRLALRIRLVDATYFVISTVTTVGYGDFNLHDAPDWVKFYGCGLMFCGAAMLALIVGLVTDFILRTRFHDVIARGSARSKGHVVVAGLGNIGLRLVQGLLQDGEQVVAVESSEEDESLQTARGLAPVVLGNPKMEDTLRRAGTPGAKALLAVTDDDLVNLSIALAAKQMSPGCRIVTRIFDSTLAEKMERALGLDAVLSVSSAAAPTFVGSIFCPGVQQGIVLGNHLVMIFQRTMGEGCTPGTPEAFLGENEAALWVKPAGAAAYQIAATEQPLAAGDRVVGISWRSFVG